MPAPRKFLLIVAPLAALLSLTGCGQSDFSGTYGTAAKNNIQFRFSGDEVTVTKEGETITAKYKVQAKTLSLQNPQGDTLTFKIDDNGCLYDGGVLITAKACKQ